MMIPTAMPPRAFAYACWGLALMTAYAVAAEEPVLTIDGALAEADAVRLVLDMPTLEAMPATRFTTETIWTEGPQTFVGVELHALLELADEAASTFRATALNNYAITIPFEDAVEGGPIIAYEINGKAMSRRDKGPLWIVYPYDSDPAYRSEVIFSRSIWQLDRVTFE